MQKNLSTANDNIIKYCLMYCLVNSYQQILELSKPKRNISTELEPEGDKGRGILNYMIYI